jgi:hypothetical protein
MLPNTICGTTGEIFTATRTTWGEKHYPLLAAGGKDLLKAP